MKRFISFVTAYVIMFTMVLYLPLTKKNIVYADNYEYAWFPLRTMYLTQLSFESYSHGNSYHIDCSGNYEQYAFAPFTGKVVFTTSNYGTVLFQSLDKVHYADGSLDYMTVIFMHCSNYDELEQYRLSGKIIKQGEDFLKVGGTGSWGDATAYAKHYDIGIYKGAISWPSSYYSQTGNMYPFESFFINRDITRVVQPGLLYYANTLTRGSYSNWSGLWKDLILKIEPSKPNLSISSGSSTSQTTFSWNACSNTDRYDLRVFAGDESQEFIYQQTTGTSISLNLPEGNWSANVVAVNNTSNGYETYGWSDKVSFSTGLGICEPKAVTSYNGHVYALYNNLTYYD